MPDVMIKSQHEGRIAWIGRVEDRAATLASEPAPSLDLGFEGALGESHSGRTRASCGRVQMLHKIGSEIANVRQLSVLSSEEVDATARELGAERIDPAWVGASLVIEGIPDLSHLPPSSRLQGPDGATLVIDMINHPCTQTGKSVERYLPGKGPLYKPAAMGKRGVTAWVERPGRLLLGDTLTLFIPNQRAWRG